jgi:hypothetical protein
MFGGVTENELPVLAWRVAKIVWDEGSFMQTEYLAGLAYRHVASQKSADAAANL